MKRHSASAHPKDAALTKARPRGRPPLDAAFQRDRILAAATEIFIKRGFAGGNVGAIGKAAGVTKRTIYDLIGDKEALFHAVCARICAQSGTFRFDVTISTMAVRDILLKMATTILNIALAPQGVAFSRMLVVEAHRFPDLVLSVMGEARVDMHTAIADVFAGLVARQQIGAVDPSQAADTFYDAIAGSKSMRAVLGHAEPYPSASEIETRVDMVLRGFLE